MLTTVLAGFGTGLSLIVAVGAQNAFLLRQGIRAEHVRPLVALCLLSDVAAIVAGIAGIGSVLDRWPAVLPVLQVVGGVYLLGFGFRAALRAWRPGALAAEGGLPGLVAEGVLIDRLGLAPGAEVRLGTQEFRLAGRLLSAPDALGAGVSIGPRVIVRREALAEQLCSLEQVL